MQQTKNNFAFHVTLIIKKIVLLLRIEKYIIFCGYAKSIFILFFYKLGTLVFVDIESNHTELSQWGR